MLPQRPCECSQPSSQLTLSCFLSFPLCGFASLLRSFVSQGIDTIEKLRAAAASDPPKAILSEQQMVGLRIYEDLLMPIPREEVEKIGDVVKGCANEILPGSETCVMGSYRRGKAKSNDVDCLIYHKDYHDCTPLGVLMRIAERLKQQGFITDHLSCPSNPARVPEGKLDGKPLKKEPVSKAGQTYMGVCRVDGIHRRVDIKFYPANKKAFAQLHFTGNASFNRGMRLYALRIGYMLTDHGLYKKYGTALGRRQHEDSKGVSLVANSEREIFKHMGLEFVEPKDRNAYDSTPHWWRGEGKHGRRGKFGGGGGGRRQDEQDEQQSPGQA